MTSKSIMNRIREIILKLHIWLEQHERFVLHILFIFTFLYGVTFDEIHKIVLLMLLIPLVAIEIIRVGKLYFDYREFLIFIGLSTFYIFWGNLVVQGQGFALLCLFFYIFSKYVVLSHYGNNTGIITYYIVFLSLAIFVLGILEYIPFFKCYIEVGPSANYALGERWPSLWQKIAFPRGEYDAYFVPISGLLVYGLWLLKKEWKKGVVILVTVFLGIGITVLAEGRIVLGTTFVAAMACLFFYYMYTGKNKVITLSIVIGLAAVCLILGRLLYSNNIMGIKDAYLSSFMSGSGGILHNERFSLKYQQMKLLFDFPFGKCNVPLYLSGVKFIHVHDLWLDIARRGGLIPFTLVCIYSIVSTIDLIRVWKIDELDIGTKMCLTGFFYAVNMHCWLEPTIVMRKSFWGLTYSLAGFYRGLILLHQGEKTTIKAEKHLNNGKRYKG